MKVSILGAGNGGQALAGWIAAKGHDVLIYDRDPNKIDKIKKSKSICLTGVVNTHGQLCDATTDIVKAVSGADLIMVATTATAHAAIASQIARHLEDNQCIVLNPGRTGGALEFSNTLKKNGLTARIYLGEAQTLVFACRLIETGIVNIIGIKDRVLFSALPSTDTPHILSILSELFNCFYSAENVLQIGFENIGAMFHPTVVLFNITTIERGSEFFFYRDMTDSLARLIETIDKERLAVAEAYGFKPKSTFEWLSYAYDGVKGDTLCERMQNNPAYYEILAPTTIRCRQITEDIPTGLIPIAELGKAAGVMTPICDSVITLCSSILDKDFSKQGRTLKNLGLAGKNREEILEAVK